ncbi:MULTISPECIES: acyl-CoA dehydrogenase family protein [Thermomonospora]|uniref:Acyl-CoA dehydrogenase domain protein n=1 Tax=Thermomonospora curvata (strain ATCC 19995 / DSM 43183 / JCM 3096 / KCTC 9072 / NBRC 15933 / NCIMB 10081 / Henssen B9) TaxID=471852 RepID=D1A6G0_THECD|nr:MULTISPECIES: acyl-CoA dehydrogenase family protein [Thermomonospora]ACY96435.1 acyl-CoA dehydrogenase domain protein [Thermomonospora curvata DSM 43183]PKK15834.1 MAG: acyl-CoA dehydrogenase [Thermomonospora sp. CIF 1]
MSEANREPTSTMTAQAPVAVDERTARKVAEAARETEWRLPSFGKQLFMGRLRLDLVHPHPRPSAQDTERGEAFLAKLREFCAEQVDPVRIEREARIPDEVVAGLREIGALGMKIPEKYGGLGLSQFYYGRALMLVGSVSPALGALLSAHQSIGVPQPVMLFGTDEQKETWLPRCVNEISAFLLTEPDVGSDPARLRATAVPTPDGEEYVLNGVKLWTTNGVVADLLVVMARVPESPGHRGGISAFVVEADSPGITVENRNAFMGLRGIENGVTRFHDVRVPARNLIGREGAGLKIALTTLNTGRLSLPALCAGGGKWAAKIAREWCRERVQWGRPIGEHEAIAGKLAFITATTYALEAMVDLAALLADDERNDIRIEAALAKLYGSEMSWRIADELVQLRGGRGYETAESLAARGERGVPAEQLLRDLRINRIFEGSTEIMHLLIAREAVDAHLAVAGDIIDPEATPAAKARAAARAGGFYARWLPTLVSVPGRSDGSYGEFGPLAPHLRYVERCSRRLARSVFYAAARWQGALERKQGFLGRMVDIGAELFAMTAVCVRARRDARGPAGAGAYELAGAFCDQARLRVEALFDALWRNTDARDSRLARRIMAGEFTWLEEGVLDPSIPGPWIADTTPGPSKAEDVHRKIP